MIISIPVEHNGRSRGSSGFPLFSVIASNIFFILHHIRFLEEQFHVAAIIAATVVDIAALLVTRWRF